jgi:predicted transcriptional regulator of viral defense system
MILSDLTGYLTERRRAPLTDLAARLEVDPEALRGMLSTLERKGRVRRIANGAACGSGCGKCDQATVETYEWVGGAAGSATGPAN